MTEWFTAAALAGLPDLPTAKRSVQRRADREQWTRRAIGSNGGRTYEYHIGSLPAAAQAALRDRITAASAAARAGAEEGAKLLLREKLSGSALRARRLDALKAAGALPAGAQQRINAKLAILRALDAYRRAEHMPLLRAEHEFATLYNAQAGALDDDVRRLQPAISARSLQRWRLTIRQDGITALAGAYGAHRKGAGKIDAQPEVRELIIAVLSKKPHARATHIMQILQARLGERAALPSTRSLERWLTRFKKDNAQTLTALANPDEWKNKYMVSHGSMSEGIVRFNQRWELDSTPADVMLTDGRHSIIGAIDVYSRRLKLLVSKTSKATAIATLVRHALLDWGVPEEAKTDNGSDYTSHHLTRVFCSLDIHQSLCAPFAAWEKPHIERAFGTFTRDLVELLDGFIGHNVAERKAIESRKSFAERLMTRGEVVDVSLSAAEFQKFCDDWCDTIYMHRSHDGLGGKSPFDVLAAWNEPVTRIEDERALDILLAEAPGNGLRTAQKNGIAIDNAWFIAPELEAFVGQQVQVRFDPVDLGRIYVFGGPDLQFACIAECPERTGINRQELAARARELQKKRVQEERAALRAAGKKLKTDDLVDEIIRDRAMRAGKLKVFPKRTDAHDSAGLRAASDAVAALDAPRFDTGDVMSSEEFQVKRAALEAARQQPAQPIFETPFQRAYWLNEQALKRELTPEEIDYLAQFRKQNPRGFADIQALIAGRSGLKSEA